MTCQEAEVYLRIPLIQGLASIRSSTDGRPYPPHSIYYSESKSPEIKLQRCFAPATLAPVRLSCPIGGGRSSGLGRVAGVGGRAAATSNTEPIENIIGLNRNVVVYVSSADGLKIGSVG